MSNKFDNVIDGLKELFDAAEERITELEVELATMRALSIKNKDIIRTQDELIRAQQDTIDDLRLHIELLNATR